MSVQVPQEKQKIFEHSQYIVWKFVDKPGFFFQAGMAVDADGAPNAYHPQDQGLDSLEHAGEQGNWWALVTDNYRLDGKPIIQKSNDPYPGFYISKTALYDATKELKNPQRYVDSRKIPYIVLPQNNNEEFLKLTNVNLGDFAVVYNTKNHKMAFAIFADTSLYFAGGIEEYRFGEGSIALANMLEIPSNPRNGGVSDGLLYLVFPGSGNGQPRDVSVINYQTKKLFQNWGGLSQLQACFQ
ncbi:MAG: glycoside hydrolase family 75 protein [Fischerella sp. CENA71]|nr:glycoside hydrolase family 75 protein [Fischerella sp. CENA71]